MYIQVDVDSNANASASYLVSVPDAEWVLVARGVGVEELEVSVAHGGASALPDLDRARLAALEQHAALLDRRLPAHRALLRPGPAPAHAARRQLERL